MPGGPGSHLIGVGEHPRKSAPVQVESECFRQRRSYACAPLPLSGGSRDPRGGAVSFAQEVRRAVEAAPRMNLPELAKALWRALAEGLVSESEAEELSGLIEARKTVPVRPEPSRVGSRPRTDASLERRRRWGAAGLLPPGIAAHFTPGETAALAALALEISRIGDCRWPLARLAAVAGVSVSTAKRALREAKRLGLIEVEERRVSWWRNDPNVVRIVSPAWSAWLTKGGGVQARTGTVSRGSTGGRETAGTGSKGCRGSEGGRPMRQDAPPLRNPRPWRRSAGPAGR